MPIIFEELSDAFQFVRFSETDENHAYICKASGRIYLHSDIVPDLDELPEDIEDEEKYVPIPGQKELDLGRPVVMDFAHEFLPDDVDNVRDIFRKRGAYGRFKSLVVQRGVLQQWHDYQAKAEELALREWCADNEIEVAD